MRWAWGPHACNVHALQAMQTFGNIYPAAHALYLWTTACNSYGRTAESFKPDYAQKAALQSSVAKLQQAASIRQEEMMQAQNHLAETQVLRVLEVGTDTESTSST